MPLRDYQQSAIDRVRDAIRQGKRRVLCVAPTGSGKTVIGSHIVANAVAKNKRVLWLTHRNELVEQTARALKRCDITAGLIGASFDGHVERTSLAQVAMVQTLLARKPKLDADVVIFDEAHHSVAPEWMTVLAGFPNACHIGLTATPERSDGRGLGSFWHELIEVVSVQELTDQGHLVPCTIYRPDRVLSSKTIAQAPVDAWKQYAHGRKAIVFGRFVEHAVGFADQFRSEGIAADWISGDEDMATRREKLARFASGETTVLCNVFVLTEGFDVPDTGCVILARGCKTSGTYLQMVGRSLRPAPGKTDAILIDLRGVSHLHGAPADSRVYTLSEDEAGIKLAENESPTFCLICGAVLDSLPCEECGATEQDRSLFVARKKLEKWASFRAEPEDSRVRRLASWARTARENGYRPGWYLHKYKSVYGEWPTAAVKARANA